MNQNLDHGRAQEFWSPESFGTEPNRLLEETKNTRPERPAIESVVREFLCPERSGIKGAVRFVLDPRWEAIEVNYFVRIADLPTDKQSQVFTDDFKRGFNKNFLKADGRGVGGRDDTEFGLSLSEEWKEYKGNLQKYLEKLSKLKQEVLRTGPQRPEDGKITLVETRQDSFEDNDGNKQTASTRIFAWCSGERRLAEIGSFSEDDEEGVKTRCQAPAVVREAQEKLQAMVRVYNDFISGSFFGAIEAEAQAAEKELAFFGRHKVDVDIFFPDYQADTSQYGTKEITLPKQDKKEHWSSPPPKATAQLIFPKAAPAPRAVTAEADFVGAQPERGGISAEQKRAIEACQQRVKIALAVYKPLARVADRKLSGQLNNHIRGLEMIGDLENMRLGTANFSSQRIDEINGKILSLAKLNNFPDVDWLGNYQTAVTVFEGSNELLAFFSDEEGKQRFIEFVFEQAKKGALKNSKIDASFLEKMLEKFTG